MKITKKKMKPYLCCASRLKPMQACRCSSPHVPFFSSFSLLFILWPDTCIILLFHFIYFVAGHLHCIIRIHTRRQVFARFTPIWDACVPRFFLKLSLLRTSPISGAQFIMDLPNFRQLVPTVTIIKQLDPAVTTI